ncbi:hypothetical protein GCM10025865_04850 [Paraoerskovia sediminicola]|uniref:Roadblock/LAMTOR2 domain-containing protein n=1 Tax=Paraoerskovia sediminicola TaxID=1138587 RepID=A0ABM8FZJ0_9CELL|nr:hypothetical protein GCM10025865_04850 [Paraoerskovia sediminicola]
MRDGALDAGDAEEVLLGLLDALRDRGGHLLGLAVADADLTVTVADDDESGEAEATTTLDDLRHAVDRDDALDELVLVRGVVAAAATTVAAPAALAAATALATASVRLVGGTLGAPVLLRCPAAIRESFASVRE